MLKAAIYYNLFKIQEQHPAERKKGENGGKTNKNKKQNINRKQKQKFI
jgi:hypothetical protein